MAATVRGKYNGLICGTAKPTLGASLTNIATAATFAGALNYQGATALPSIADPNYIALTLEPDTANEEIVWLTAYTTTGTTGTLLRGQEGTTAVAHASGVAFTHGPTVIDAAGPMGLGVYGDGSDGFQTFDATTTILGLVPTSSTYTLLRDLFLNGATINSGVSIITNGYRLFWGSGTLTNNGTIKWDGQAGALGVAGAATKNLSGSLGVGNLGAPGAVSNNTVGIAGTAEANSQGGNGGASGAGPGGAGAAGGIAGSGTSTLVARLRFVPASIMGIAIQPGSTPFPLGGGAGGASGAGDGGSNTGGAGGAGGGVIVLAGARIAGVGAIHARGGAGETTSVTNSGGGGGGGGGWVAITSGSVSGGAVPGQTIDANGGAAGSGFGTGTTGFAGSPGNVYLVPN